MVLDGPINGEMFQAYVERVLVSEPRPGSTVILDNLGSRKGAGVHATIEAAGASLLHLPPYSPDFNPIENALPNSRPHSKDRRPHNRHPLIRHRTDHRYLHTSRMR